MNWNLDQITLHQFYDDLHALPLFGDVELGQGLSSLPLFRFFDEKTLAELAKKIKIRSFAKNHVIARQGDYDTSLYFVMRGCVQVAYLGDHEKATEFQVGEFFGESGAISGNPRNANLIAIDESLLLEIPRLTFLHYYDENTEFRDYINGFYIKRAVWAHLRSVDFFKDLPEDEFSDLITKAQLRRYQTGEAIFKQDEPGSSLFLVRTGFVRISVIKEGREVILTYMKEGNYFGEMALLSGENRTANIIAETTVECIEIYKEDFDIVLAKHPEILKQVQKKVQERIEEQKRRLAESSEESEATRERFNIFKDLVQAEEILAIDMKSCIRCNNCVSACETTHGVARMSVSGDVIDDYIITSSCRHCSNPKCLLCNYDAIGRDRDGEIYFTSNCIGCGDCAKNCPYGMITMVNPKEKVSLVDVLSFWKKNERPESRSKRQPIKCNMCHELPYQSCVSNCPTNAMKFISLDDLASSGHEVQ